MGEALVGAMVAAMRRANRSCAEATRTARTPDAREQEGSAWGYLVHPALMPTVYSPGDDATGPDDEEVAERKV